MELCAYGRLVGLQKAHRPSQLETFKEYQKLRLQQMRESQPQAGDADEVAGAVDEGSAEVELGEVVGSASGPVDVVATHLSTALPLPATLPAITSTDEATAIAEISATASTSESTASVSQPPPKVIKSSQLPCKGCPN